MKQLLLQLQKHQFIQVFLTILLLGNRKIFFFLLGPLLGHFYSLHVSLTDVASTGLVIVHSKSTSTTNSNASKSHASKTSSPKSHTSTTSSSKSSYPARRPCLLWDILDNTVEVKREKSDSNQITNNREQSLTINDNHSMIITMTN